MVPCIALVTPSLDVAESIDRTIISVVSQAGRFAIRYHVQDYGSSDGTTDRLRAWNKRLGTGDFPLQCDGVRFTWSSGPDEGLSAALLRGFGSLDLPDDPFMSWIHAGDVLMPGALAQVASVCQQFNAQDLAWLSGATAVLQGDVLANIDEHALPSRAIRAGLCDGLHWPRVRPEGTFFRKWLWEAAEPGSVFASFGLAGDWALWRAFAQRAVLVQARVPLAAAPSVLDETAAYLAEIDAHMPPEARHAELRALLEAGDIRRQVLCSSDMAAGLQLQDAPVDMTAARRVLQRHSKHALPTSPDRGHSGAPPPRAIDSVREDTDRRATLPMYDDIGPDWLVHTHAIMGMDSHWQFPAITEQHAFARLSGLLADTPQEVLYVAFPWATLIDKLKTGAPDRHALMDRFEALCALLPSDRHKVTVCQHILARDYADLFRQAGIQDVFWVHTSRDDLSSDAAGGGPRFHPFPLYPVQTPEARPEDPPASDAAPREYLFSFIGAKANKFYLTQARSWILEHLATDPRGLIRGRDGWHYQRVVYDLQVRKTAQDDGNGSFVDRAASEEFRAALCNSTFALCPSGTGPNSIRLWEALAAGAIPVILADSWAPPGERRLWDLAAIFCEETPEDIRALPERLASIAADPARLASMRHAMRQLWLLYGAPFFVSDLLEFMLAHASRSEGSGAGTPDSALSARQLLVSWSGRLLLEPETALDALGIASGPAAALTAARRRCTDPTVQAHFDAALSRALKRSRRALPQLAPPDPAGTTPDTAVATPAFVRGAPLRVCLFGRHSNRTPLAYDAFRRHLDDHFIWTTDPAKANLVVTGFDRDFREAARQLHALVTTTTGPRLAVISEEPLWDITWSGAPEGGQHGFSQGDIRLDYAYLAHGSSEIFQSGTLPYYVLTENRFITRFASLISRQAQRTPEDILAHWRRAPLPAAFFAEKRKGANYHMDKPSGRIVKLSTYRTELAEQMQERGALCMGKGWGGNTPRQALPDWHLDKLAWLQERCAVMGALENTHHGLYVSEKIFDAFACGAVPVYFAGQDHRVFDLVPEAAMINTYGLDVAAAVARLEAFVPDTAMARSWLDTAARLAKLFGDPALIERERKRVADAVVAEVQRLV